MKTLISIDPGMSTGVAVGTYSDTEPFKLTHFFQIEGGVEGFLENVKVNHSFPRDEVGLYTRTLALPPLGTLSVTLIQEAENEGAGIVFERPAQVIAEKFTARGGANAEFSYRTKDLEPLRVEGAMLAMGLDVTWVSPAQQYFSGGEGKAKKKQAQHRWLKEKGLYVTGKMVGCDNADDVRSAIAHAIAYLVRSKHRPTIEHYFPKETDD